MNIKQEVTLRALISRGLDLIAKRARKLEVRKDKALSVAIERATRKVHKQFEQAESLIEAKRNELHQRLLEFCPVKLGDYLAPMTPGGPAGKFQVVEIRMPNMILVARVIDGIVGTDTHRVYTKQLDTDCPLHMTRWAKVGAE